MRLVAAFGLLLFAPVTAEYLYGYDDSTGNLAEQPWLRTLVSRLNRAG